MASKSFGKSIMMAASLALATFGLSSNASAQQRTPQDSINPPVQQVEDVEPSELVLKRIQVRKDQMHLLKAFYKGSIFSSQVDMRSHIIDYYDSNVANPEVLPKYDDLFNALSEFANSDVELSAQEMSDLRRLLSKVEDFYANFLTSKILERQTQLNAAKKAGKSTDDIQKLLDANKLMKVFTEIFVDGALKIANGARKSDVKPLTTTIPKPSKPLI